MEAMAAQLKEQAAQIQKVSASLKQANLRRKWSTIPKGGAKVRHARDSSRRRSQYGTRVHPRSLPALCVVLEHSRFCSVCVTVSQLHAPDSDPFRRY